MALKKTQIGADGQMAILSRKPVGTPVSTGRTAGFIRWKSTAGIPIMPDESGINDRLKPVLHLAIRSIRPHPLNPYKIICGIGVICVNQKRHHHLPALLFSGKPPRHLATSPTSCASLFYVRKIYFTTTILVVAILFLSLSKLKR